MNKKYCMVPLCFNSTVKTPEKLFFRLPNHPKRRKKWLTAARRAIPLRPKTTAYCCEDHFDVEKDMANYVKFKLVGGKLVLRNDVVPHKFACQNRLVEKPERPVIAKLKAAKFKQMLTENTEYPASTSQDIEQLYIVDPVTVKVENVDIDPLRDISTEDTKKITKKHKKIQVNIKNKVTYKGTQTSNNVKHKGTQTDLL